MKKLVTILAVLLVASAVFASVSVRAGGTFVFAGTNTAVEEETIFTEESKVKANGFGFGTGVQADVSDNLALYVDFNMVFPKDATIKDGEAPEYKISDVYDDYKINFFGISAGLAYTTDLNAVKLAVGGGVSLNRAQIKMIAELSPGEEFEVKESITNIGLNALIDAKFMFNESMGLGLTLNPQLGLYNITNLTFTTTGEDPEVTLDQTAKEFKVGYAIPVSVGISYSF